MKPNSFTMLRAMTRIRAFETALAARPDHGFQLLSSGEEAVAVGLSSALNAGDQLLTGGRSIGPVIARGADPRRVMAELLGKTDGMNGGRAGRGHLSDPGSGFFGAHAVVGGNISIAAGVALAKQLDDDGSIVAVLFGDGACGSGALHETLNMAAIWKLPLLFVCNNNQWSVSTARQDALAPRRLSDIGATFGLPACTIDGLDVEGVAATIGEAADKIRQGHGPAFVECTSIRLRSHSTTARETRKRQELAELLTHCPIRRQIARLGLDEDTVEMLDREAAEFAAEALAFAEASPYPSAAGVLTDVG
ncbi:MAG TPA: thiamine pyrophosphate-dependent dehydrogenase E1 component subunit alpha [Acidisoma sp.]|uniref:thiamine pyrophosphate-dependent dehydrogenase E1 component subunit alpha n=1 Tax=Acidisoma sp. TaxID=1872115 RepID=UPI002C4CCDF2|nr:thiamine pyrophosphate-dependent dehydrogenase E1 component subunit alpha [Acidisoma sp.]HTI01910.1 thiamine pyrophosphate-dependent dehydrogenase E1 component subunit alpha [Acidisoma sp.]